MSQLEEREALMSDSESLIDAKYKDCAAMVIP